MRRRLTVRDDSLVNGEIGDDSMRRVSDDPID